MQEVNGLKITDVKLKKLNNLGRLVGEVSITINDCLVIHNIQIIQLEDKKILSFPHKRLPNGSIADIAHPIISEFRKYVEEVIFNIYDTGVEE